MDISHIDSISKKIWQLPDYPCCCTSEAIDFEPFPSSLPYAQLVEGLPCFNPSNDPAFHPYDTLDGYHQAQANYDAFNESRPFRPRQQKAMESFHFIHSTVLRNINRNGLSLNEVKQYAACFDEFFFCGKLMERCTIEWVDNQHNQEWFKKFKETGTFGMTVSGDFCTKHRQQHGARILLLRRSLGENGKPLPPRKQLESILYLLLHELSHAWVSIFSAADLSIWDAIEEIGATGHGKAWKNVHRACIWAARDHFGLKLADASGQLCEHNEDTIFAEAAEKLVRSNLDVLNPAELETTISRTLDTPPEHARLFSKLVERGLLNMEALLVIGRSSLALGMRPDLDISDILPIGWDWK